MIAELAAAIALAIAGAPSTVGHSADGRPIQALRTGAAPSAPRVLVFGCIHGDECAGIRAARLAADRCTPGGAELVVVENLNPDGREAGTRLNAHGVDLNRNFASHWQPLGAPGDAQYSGPAPFSEPETRLARRLIRTLQPAVTIWFHQEQQPLVRAWGPSVGDAREYARLSGEPFFRMPWLDGTAPNWQNHRFAGTSSFVVELPSAGPVHARRHARAICELTRRVGERARG